MTAVFRHWPIRAQLFAVLLAVLLPAAATIGYAIAHASRQSLAMALEGVHDLAEQTADRLGNLMHDREIVLVRLSARPLVRALDLRRCDPVIAEYVHLHPEYNTLGVRDVEGNIVCSFIPNPPKAAEVIGAPWFQRAIRSDGFAASDAHLGQPSAQWVTVLTHPIRDDAGKTIGIAVLALNLQRLQARVLHTVPQGAIVSVIDRSNRFLLRSIDPQTWIGKEAGSPELARRALSDDPGTLQARGIDGIERVHAYRAVPGTGWLVIAGVPEETVYAGHRERLRNAIALGGAALLLAFGLAWAIGRRIVLPLRELERVARAAGDGDLTARARAGGSLELVTVATQFNRMLDAREYAETGLRLANQRYALAATTGDVWDWNIATNAITSQPEFWRRLGYQDAEVRDQVAFFESVIHPEDLAHWRQVLKDHLARRSPYDLKFRMRAKSGDYRTFHTHGQAIWDERGRATYMAGTTFDITERERAEETVRTGAQRLRLAVQAAKLHHWEWQIETDSLTWDRDPAPLLGEADGVSGAYPDFRALVHPEDRERFLAAGRAALDHDQPYEVEFRILRPGGEPHWLAAMGTVLRDAEGRPQRMLGVTQDITTRKQGEEKIEQQLEELRRWYQTILGREDRVQQLKREVNELRARLGESPRYADPASGPESGR